MAVTFRRQNILLLVLSFFVVTFFLWTTRQTRLGPLPSSWKSPPVVSFPGPVLQQPEVRSKNETGVSIQRTYTLHEMRERASTLNFAQAIHNTEKFGDHRADDPVIVIQVHDRHDFLQLLLDSLRAVEGIESATLLLSRDKFTPEMDSVIEQNIDFCRYVEIFFPFAMQLFPKEFPGEDPNDCPRDLTKIEAKGRGCNNAEFPDKYGHYREVKFVQLKHHWFWKLHMVFEGVRQIKTNTGPIVFLEDDNYVLPDLIDVMRKSTLLRDQDCPDCMSVTLGSYSTGVRYGAMGAFADVKPWTSSQYNMGMILGQKFFDELKSCVNYFCTYDDYNWDWSLQATALNCFTTPLHSVILQAPRVYHLGCNGFHQKKGGCDAATEVNKLKSMIEAERSNLFPQSLKMNSAVKTPNAAHETNGGWGDIRDHELCKSYGNLCKSFTEMDSEN